MENQALKNIDALTSTPSLEAQKAVDPKNVLDSIIRYHYGFTVDSALKPEGMTVGYDLALSAVHETIELLASSTVVPCQPAPLAATEAVAPLFHQALEAWAALPINREQTADESAAELLQCFQAAGLAVTVVQKGGEHHD